MSWVVKVVALFAEGEGRLPKDLGEVFARKLPTGRSDDPTTDLFSHPLAFAADADGKGYSVSSLGKDGKPGGRGADADVKVHGP